MQINRVEYYPAFKFSPEDFPGAVNPELDGCHVIAVCAGDEDGKRCRYLFQDMTEYMREIGGITEKINGGAKMDTSDIEQIGRHWVLLALPTWGEKIRFFTREVAREIGERSDIIDILMRSMYITGFFWEYRKRLLNDEPKHYPGAKKLVDKWNKLAAKSERVELEDVEALAEFIEKHSKEGELFVPSYGFVEAILIACEVTGRVCLAAVPTVAGCNALKQRWRQITS